MIMNTYQKFHSFAPSEQPSPKTQKQSTSQSINTHKFSIHIPEELLESKLSESLPSSNIKVYCRLRPEVKRPNIIKYDTTMIDDGERLYSFDKVFGKLSTQEEVFFGVAERHIQDFLSGNNSTIFAYGQTGSGKTHTMFGQIENKQNHGIIPRTLQSIFKRDLKSSTITCSMVEIYNDKLGDLLNPMQNSDIKLKETTQGIFLEGLIEVSVDNQDELMNLIKLGHRSRKIATTFTNDASSRSHTVLFLYRNFVIKNQDRRCKLCFIDLAGSEKIRKSGAKGQSLQQAKKINLSLSSLGNVIHALTNGSDYIPYRDSKLTRILKDSLGGDIKTSIVTTCSLNQNDHHQTISTIKFAVRAKKIKNKSKIKSDDTLEDKVEHLTKELQAVQQKYRDIELELAFYKKKPQINISMQEDMRDVEDMRDFEDKENIGEEIPEEEANYQPLRSSYLSGGMSSRANIRYSSLKSE